MDVSVQINKAMNLEKMKEYGNATAEKAFTDIVANSLLQSKFVAFCDQVTTSSNITLSQCMKFQLYQSISTKAFHSATNRVLKQTKECMKSKLGTLAFRTKLKAICSNNDELI